MRRARDSGQEPARCMIYDERTWEAHTMTRRSLSEVQRWLASTGFEEALIADNGELRSSDSEQRFDPAELSVAAVYRFEGESDPGDGSILFALASVDGEPVGVFTAAYGPSVSPTEETIISSLHGPPQPADEIRAHADHDHIAAVFANRDEAGAAVSELRNLGLGSEHLGVAVHGPTHVAFEHDEELDLAQDAEIGTAAGASLGLLAGLALAAVAIPGLGVLGLGGLFAVGAASGFGGAMLGGFLGIAAADRELLEHAELAETPLDPGEVLVAVCSHGEPQTVEGVMERHGGKLLSQGPARH